MDPMKKIETPSILFDRRDTTKINIISFLEIK